ncbi:MAG: helix-turn-helix domain-containing protein [Clostridia bacterium]|nr:helix-turn-helix domain-containing protein [Clostridia bacterium]
MKDTTLFELASDLHETGDVGMYYCGKRIETIHHSYGPEIQNYYLFVLVNKGEASFFHKSGTIKLKAHDLLVMCPGEKIHYVAHTPWSIQWVGLYGQTVDSYMDRLGINGDRPIVHIQKYYELEKILSALYETMGERYEHAKCAQLSLIYQFFGILLQNSKQSITADAAESVRKMIDFNFNQRISMEEIASSLFITPEHLARRFARRYGISPKAYLLEKRIAAAQRLLCETDASILEVANSVGYDDQLYFSRIFKKKTGLSPLAYKKQLG